MYGLIVNPPGHSQQRESTLVAPLTPVNNHDHRMPRPVVCLQHSCRTYHPGKPHRRANTRNYHCTAHGELEAILGRRGTLRHGRDQTRASARRDDVPQPLMGTRMAGLASATHRRGLKGITRTMDIASGLSFRGDICIAEFFMHRRET